MKLSKLVTEAAKLGSLPGGSTHEHADWLIGPCGQHRDSSVTDACNFEVAQERLLAIDPNEQDHEIHRFGHFGVGWVEEIATRPGSACATLAAEMRASLDAYPLLDEDRCGVAEHEAANESWDSWQCKQLRRDLETEIAEYEGFNEDSAEALVAKLDDSALYDLMAEQTGPEIDDEGSYRICDRDVVDIAAKLVS